jgi:WD40 repeat protein
MKNINFVKLILATYDYPELDKYKRFFKHKEILEFIANRTNNFYNVNFENHKELKVHSNFIFCLLQLQNRRYFASGSGDNLLNIINKNTLEVYKTLTGHFANVSALCQLDNGLLVACSWDQSIIVWDPSLDYECIKVIIDGHSKYVTCLVQSGGYLISGSRDMLVKVWNIDKDFELEQTLAKHTDYVQSVVKLKDDRIASSSWDKTIIIWDLKTFTADQQIYHGAVIQDLLTLRNGDLASCGGFFIKIWDCKNNFNLKLELKSSGGGIYSLLELQDGRLISGDTKGVLKLWDLRNKSHIEDVMAHSDTVFELIQLDDGRVVSGSFDQTIKVWK